MSRGPNSAERTKREAERAGARAAEKAEVAGRLAAAKGERTGRLAAEQAGRRGGRARGGAGQEEEGGEGLIWFREEPVSRRPFHTRADIARSALEIADSEGFDAVSMRRVAQRLGAGTMTLYHYVRNKDELITLMGDLVMGEILVPEDQLSGDWRTAVTQVATRTRKVFAEHRWILDHLGDGRPGPNGMRHFEQSLAAIASLELPREEVFELIGQVDDYVFGYALREAQELEEHEHGWPVEVVDFLQRELDSGNYPLISHFFGDDAEAGIGRMIEMDSAEGRFERGLHRLLDGIEASLQ